MSTPASGAAAAGGTYHDSSSDADSTSDSDSDSDSVSPTSPWRPLYGNPNPGTTGGETVTVEGEDAATAIEHDFRTILAISVAHVGGRHEAVHGILRASLQALTQEAIHSGGAAAASGVVPVPWTFVMHAASVNLVRYLCKFASFLPFPFLSFPFLLITCLVLTTENKKGTRRWKERKTVDILTTTGSPPQ